MVGTEVISQLVEDLEVEAGQAGVVVTTEEAEVDIPVVQVMQKEEAEVALITLERTSIIQRE